MYRFPLEEQESIIKKDHANLYCDGDAYTGAFYLTNERIVFVGYLMDIHDKYIAEVPLTHISEIRPGKTMFFIPNAIDIETIKNRKLRFIVNKRDKWLEAISRQMDNCT